MDALGQRYNQEASNDQCKEANRIQLCPQSQYRARHSDRCKATTAAEVVRLMGPCIRVNSLQNPKSKRNILVHAKIKALFGKGEATLLKVTGVVGRYLG